MNNRSIKEQTITRQLRILFKAIQAHSKKVETACGLSGAKLWMLHEIATTPGIRVSRLADALSIHPSTCSNMLDKIEKLQLVTRDRSKSDQRSVHLYVTDKGQELLAKAPSPPQGQVSSTLQKLSEEQLEHLELGLKSFIDVLHYEDEKAGLIPIPEA
jgi:DNA-binding MarR family transcriptional regulator